MEMPRCYAERADQLRDHTTLIVLAMRWTVQHAAIAMLLWLNCRMVSLKLRITSRTGQSARTIKI